MALKLLPLTVVDNTPSTKNSTLLTLFVSCAVAVRVMLPRYVALFAGDETVSVPQAVVSRMMVLLVPYIFPAPSLT